MFGVLTKPIEDYPCLRRYLDNGFQHNPSRDAPAFGYVCLETPNQVLFVEPESGYFRAGRTLRS